MMRIALIAHDKMKPEIIEYAKKYKEVLKKHDLVATGTTGHKIIEATGLKIHCFQSGPLGGDQEIGARIANGQIDLIIFLRDPLTPQPHEPDVSALLRLSDVHKVPLATNIRTAELIAHALEEE
jgi:methylglyoxal synthase